MDGERGAVAGAAGSRAASATMLAELAGRIAQLQQELDAVRRGPEPASPPPPAPAAPRALHAVAPTPEPGDGEQAPPARRPPANVDLAEQAAHAQVIRVILAQAEQEAAQALAEAGRRIDDVRARVRALLEAAQAAPADRASIAAPVPFVSLSTTPAKRPARPELQTYAGAVMVEVGPFTNVVQLSEFEDALASVPAVQEVYIRTFERRQAHFELYASWPTTLIAELQARAPDALYVIEASERHVRLEIFKDEAE